MVLNKYYDEKYILISKINYDKLEKLREKLKLKKINSLIDYLIEVERRG